MLDLGKKLQTRRLDLEQTQLETSLKLDVVREYIGLIEVNRLKNLTPAQLKKVTRRAYKISAPKFFSYPDNSGQVVLRHKKAYTKRRGKNGSSATFYAPSPNANRKMEPVLWTLAPGESTPVDKPHGGEECGYVIKGSVVLTVDDKRFRVMRGDMFYFQSCEKHFISNENEHEAQFLWITTN